jgi:hypothetical protein
MSDFEEHEQAALEQFLWHIETCARKHDSDLRIDDALLDEFHGGRQMKMVGEIVKLKWEVSCPFCPLWAIYYCVMTHAAWKPPHNFQH